MSEFDMNMAAQQRPLNHHKQSGASQWATDKALGILDWDGLDLKAAEKCIAGGNQNEAETQSKFKMSYEQLVVVVDGWHRRFATQKA